MLNIRPCWPDLTTTFSEFFVTLFKAVYVKYHKGNTLIYFLKNFIVFFGVQIFLGETFDSHCTSQRTALDLDCIMLPLGASLSPLTTKCRL